MDTNERGDFTGKVAFVTGAANGIGHAAALAFAREGASVVVADVSEKGNQETARMIQDLGGHALAVTCDVAQNEDVRRALDATVKTFGRLDLGFREQRNSYQKPSITVLIDSIFKFFQVDSVGMLRMTSSARYFNEGVGSRRPN
jgi:NAD(P)-dependent dehydrogenase (short-subunit alcohol dehydrogenase family)